MAASQAVSAPSSNFVRRQHWLYPFIAEVDVALQVLAGQATAARPNPAEVAKLEAAFKEVMSSPAIRQKMESNGFVVPVQGVKPYSDFVASELPRWTKVIKTAGIKPQ